MYIVDFEEALINALRQTFPGGFREGEITINGCHFHYAQCVYRRILEKCPLLRVRYNDPDYDNNAPFRKWIYKLLALAFVDPLDVVEAFLYLENQANTLYPQHMNFDEFERAELVAFLNYFKGQWIYNGISPAEQRIYRRIWNVHTRDALRTNNHHEGFHSMLNGCLGTNPSLWTCIT